MHIKTMRRTVASTLVATLLIRYMRTNGYFRLLDIPTNVSVVPIFSAPPLVSASEPAVLLRDVPTPLHSIGFPADFPVVCTVVGSFYANASDAPALFSAVELARLP